MEIKSKICKECGRELPLEMFSKNKAMRDGHVNICKDCQREQRRKRKDSKIIPAINEGTMIPKIIIESIENYR